MIELKQISKEFTDQFGFKVKLLENISFIIPVGKILSIISPVGSGKSTLLKIICGLEESTAGSIKSDGKISYIPYEPSSFPWLNVRENILMGMEKKNNEIAEKFAKSVGLEGYETHIPQNGSFGFRFRISLARALAQKPSLIVLDETFNKMDPNTKEEIYTVVRKINNETGISFLLATSNISEALFLSDQIIVFKKNPGEIVKSFDIKFNNDRNHLLFSSKEFFDYRSQIENSIKIIDSQILSNITI